MNSIFKNNLHLTWIYPLILLIIVSGNAQDGKKFGIYDNTNLNISLRPTPNYPRSIQNFDSTGLESFILQAMNTYNIPGVAVCITNKDSIFWQGTYGYADKEKNRPVTDSTLFYIASVSKPVTATALMQLWEKGLFNLDDDINDYLPPKLQISNPFYPDKPITFHMLLTHTSSINDSYSIGDIRCYEPDCPDGYPLFTLDSLLVRIFMSGGTGPYRNVAPGSYYSYSNRGYCVLGYLVEVIADTPFVDYVKDNILEPLQMQKSFWFLADADTNNLARGYENNGQPVGHYQSPALPAAYLRSSIKELSHFVRAFKNYGEDNGVRILDSSTVALMREKHVRTDDPESYYYGYGWLSDEATHWHSGYGLNWPFTAIIECTNNNDLGLILMINNKNWNGFQEIYKKVYDIITYIAEISSKPLNFSLMQNYPNPFNPSTTIEFTLPKSEFVKVKVYDILGREVSTLVSMKLNQGKHTYTFDGKNLASGIYYYRIEAGNFIQTRKMIYLK